MPGGEVYVCPVETSVEGTIAFTEFHIALGMGFESFGSTNKSALHWDIVKDLRSGGKVELDGKIVQENGAWL